MSFKNFILGGLATSFCFAASPSARADNLVRNGSFEGSKKYWLGATASLEKGDAACGDYGLQVPSDMLQSTPFALQSDKPVTVSYSLRSEGGASVDCVVRGADRGYFQSTEGHFSFQDNTSNGWTRWTHTFIPKAIESNWVVAFSGNGPFLIDGVTITQSDPTQTTKGYVPRRDVEIAIDTPQLTLENYKKNGNILQIGETVLLIIAVSNPSGTARKLTLRTLLLDYEGKRAFSPPTAWKIALGAGKTVLVAVPVKLSGRGLMLARAQVLDGQTIIDQSEQPLTALAFPKAATKPDPRERFGASYSGPVAMQNAQRIGFAWCRWWWGDMGWGAIQPSNSQEFDWKDQDEKVDLLARHGNSVNYVLYPLPDWAKVEGSNAPKDMNWPGDDPRWDDLTIETSWDRYVSATVKHFTGKSVVFEFANEPDNPGYGWDWGQYIDMAKRTYKLVKAANPQATMLVNCIQPDPTQLQQQWAASGGAPLTDIYSWHNYGGGALGGTSTIGNIRRLLQSGGNPKAQIWFNEGGTFGNSSQDNAALVMGISPVEWAHSTVKSIAQLFAAGEEKHILFHIGYEEQGRSWYDWLCNGGAQLWDENSQPMVAVPTWNVLSDQLGLSTWVRTIKLKGAEMHVFQDKRNERGLLVAWSNDGAKTFQLPLSNLVRRDVMGNDTLLKSKGGTTTVALPADGRPFYFFTRDKQAGTTLAKKLSPLDAG